jgi:hypothetical protein
MRHAMPIALRSAAVLAAILFVNLLAASSIPSRSPYESALSSPTSTAVTATHCPDKSCASVAGGCVRSTGAFCAKSGGQCFTRGCL